MYPVTFESKLRKVEERLATVYPPDYCSGYKKGLQRQYYGDSAVSTDEHIQWISYIDNPFTLEKGKGYIDGYFSKD
jgi:hypothetical protein